MTKSIRTISLLLMLTISEVLTSPTTGHCVTHVQHVYNAPPSSPLTPPHPPINLFIAVFIIVCTPALMLIFRAKLVKSLAPSVLL